jgi:hypothetical protein
MAIKKIEGSPLKLMFHQQMKQNEFEEEPSEL